MRRRFVLIAIILMLLVPQTLALQMLSGDNISVDSPIDDDVFAAGDTITINAPVAGVVLAGGNITINAPVSGDVFAAGGTIVVNSDVDGKIVAAGGEIDLSGSATNAVLAGGMVNIRPDTVISKDAVIAGSSVINAGTVAGNLTVRAEQFQNTGTAGNVDYTRSEGLQEVQARVQQLMTIVYILMIIGFLILGLILLKVFPAQFHHVEAEVRKSPLRDTAVGFVLIIVSIVVLFLLTITVIGFPLAAVMGMLFIIALMLSSLFVSFALGRTIANLLNVKTNDMLIFILGFVILSLLFRIPVAGWLIRIVAFSLGFGAIFYAVRENWERITGTSA
ncbi:MAG: hypothetical protein JW878_06970 [Methanomicrobia archaeon]|nr:hypothetical protein [Methanomicrobia archaeon]